MGLAAHVATQPEEPDPAGGAEADAATVTVPASTTAAPRATKRRLALPVDSNLTFPNLTFFLLARSQDCPGRP
jgi:hypothetical protein